MASVNRKALNALQGLPFDNLIGGPLNACVKAQAEAAQTTLNFIRDVGLEDRPLMDKNGQPMKDDQGNILYETSAIYVHFQFIQNGRYVNLSVPLLTIVPIPYICINTIDINFKATVHGVESSSNTNESERTTQTDEDTKKGKLGWFKKTTTSIKSSVSTKRDSKSTQESSYSIEATIDVAVHASQDSMPAGMSRVLEMLNSAMDLTDPSGEMEVNAQVLYTESDGKAHLTARCKDSAGLYKEVKIEGQNGVFNPIEGYTTFELTGTKEGKEYFLTSDGYDGTQEMKVKVFKVEQATATPNNNAQKQS
jgi:hypothetical protein